ncbi:MAG: hypothetical protein IT204_03305 [Fimbriimonadaceae bacterium]|nr:hypothetical protein [Fimbriimonadaceae bacterium]
MRYALWALLAAPPLLAGSADRLHAYCWSAPPADCTNLTHLVWFNAKSDPAAVAADSLTRPNGRRAVFSWDLHRELFHHPADLCRTPDGQPTTQRGVWPEQGTATVRAKFTAFFGAFRAAGGQADYFILDSEDGYSNWSIGGETAAARWQAIQADPRFAALAVKLGFSDLSTVARWSGRRDYLKWNAVLAGECDAALQAAVFEPARACFPNLQSSNYGSLTLTEANAVPDLNGHWQWSESPGCGTHASHSFYGTIGQLAGRTLSGGQPYGRTAFGAFRLAVNWLRAMRRSSDRPVMPWLAWQRYAGDDPNNPQVAFANTSYWDELVYHLVLGDCDTLLFWNPHPWRADQPADSLSTARDEQRLDKLLAGMRTTLAGGPWVAPTLQPVPWDSPLVASALRVGPRVVWRITVPTAPAVLTARLDGHPVRLTVPAGACGVWYEHPAGGKLTDLAVGE